MSLLPVVAWRGLDASAREAQLWRWAGLAGDACAWALRAGDVRRAVEVLEQGRSITWNQITQTRTDLTAAHELAPELVGRLDELRAALDVRPPIAPGMQTALDRDVAAQARRRLAEEWDLVVERIRGIDGLRNFLAAVPYDQLAAEAAAGPVVITNLSSHHCAAIVVTEDQPIVVDLPAGALADAVYAMIDSFGDVGQKLNRADPAKLEGLYEKLRLEMKYDAEARAVNVCDRGGWCALSTRLDFASLS